MPRSPAPPSRRSWRARSWSAAALLLALPLVATELTDEVDWNLADVAIAAVLLGGAGLALELTVRASRDAAVRAGVALAVGGAVGLAWVTGAVGTLGPEGHAANGISYAVAALALGGVVWARRSPRALTRVALAVAAAQGLAGALAWVAGWGAPLGLPLAFAAVWLGAAALFHVAARRGPGAQR